MCWRESFHDVYIAGRSSNGLEFLSARLSQKGERKLMLSWFRNARPHSTTHPLSEPEPSYSSNFQFSIPFEEIMFEESRIFQHFRMLFVYTNPLKILRFILGFSRDHLLDFCFSADRYSLIPSMIEAPCASTVIPTPNFLALVVLLMLLPDIYSLP